MTPATVYLVGAGPGDPELLTVKARRLLSEADVVVHDNLVPAAFLDFTKPGCERIFAGKRPGQRCVGQEEIDRLLVDLALAGKTVVRLKGGDPLIFGRGGEEASALAAAGIPFEIVPGVTAALAAGACAGIPLTHRQVSSAVVLVTGHEDPSKPDGAVRWEDYAKLGATLCVYMGVRNLPTIALRLQAGGLSGDTPAAIVQSAATPGQLSVLATLGTIAEAAAAAGIEAPALVVIGEVAAFAGRLGLVESARALEAQHP